MDAVRLQELTKRYKDVTAVDHLSLSIQDGELFSLLGVNGAGKTTTMKMLSCLTKPDSGDALIHGKSILRDEWEIKRMIATAPQETAAALNLTVQENLEFMAGIYGFPREKGHKLLREFGLQDIKNKRAGRLSGGWQRRLSIAMALVSDPQILFLDEPSIGLDVIARNELWDSIRMLKGKVTIIMTTHFMEEARALSDRVGIMKEGRLLITGTVEEILQRTGAEDFEKAFIQIIQEGVHA